MFVRRAYISPCCMMHVQYAKLHRVHAVLYRENSTTVRLRYGTYSAHTHSMYRTVFQSRHDGNPRCMIHVVYSWYSWYCSTYNPGPLHTKTHSSGAYCTEEVNIGTWVLVLCPSSLILVILFLVAFVPHGCTRILRTVHPSSFTRYNHKSTYMKT